MKRWVGTLVVGFFDGAEGVATEGALDGGGGRE